MSDLVIGDIGLLVTESEGDVCEAWASEGDVTCDTDQFVPGALDTALAVASDVLFHLSGRQFPGICSAVVRPYGQCSCGGGCSSLREIRLGVTPIVEVTEVKVSGEVVDPSSYRVDDSMTLVRLPGDGAVSWPCCPTMDMDSSEEGTFEVSFTYGKRPPSLGVAGAAQLACEIAKSMSDLDCKLPERTTNITRQGVSISLIDPNDFLENGKTGLYLADLFLETVNPHKLSRPPGIMSPDIRTSRRAGT